MKNLPPGMRTMPSGHAGGTAAAALALVPELDEATGALGIAWAGTGTGTGTLLPVARVAERPRSRNAAPAAPPTVRAPARIATTIPVRDDGLLADGEVLVVTRGVGGNASGGMRTVMPGPMGAGGEERAGTPRSIGLGAALTAARAGVSSSDMIWAVSRGRRDDDFSTSATARARVESPAAATDSTHAPTCIAVAGA